MRQAKTLMIGTVLGTLLVWGASAVSAQAPPSGQSSQTQTPAAKAKTKTKKKEAPKPKKTSRKPGAVKEAPKQEPKVARRDPFESLVGRDRGGDSGPKLPGKAGLVISSLRLDGVVRYVDGM